MPWPDTCIGPSRRIGPPDGVLGLGDTQAEAVPEGRRNGGPLTPAGKTPEDLGKSRWDGGRKRDGKR